jgi:DNA-binding transcriptional LysR family regulator
MPELRHLRVFAAVAQERNFTRAAERLHLAQQAVSKAVAQLERELGVALLERTTREVRLTEAGRSLLADAPGVLAAADAAFARASALGAGRAGSVTVGVTPAIGTLERNGVIERLRRGAPELAVSMIELRPGDIVAALRERRADVVLSRTAPAAEAVTAAALPEAAAQLAVPEGHRLAADDGPVDAAALDGERLLVWSRPGTPYTDLLLERCAAAGAHVVPVESRVTGGDGLTELAAFGAVAIVGAGPRARPGVVLRPLNGVTLPLLAVRAAGPPAPAVARLLS